MLPNRAIIYYFKGLPLAIVIAAGVVLAINESLWISKEIEEIFYEKMCSDLVQRISELLILSYNNLPNFLKSCFLYLGVFPESSTIPVEKLITLWIAEGFVKVEGQRSLEEVAEDFLKDLVRRRLVWIDEISLDGKIRTCKVHDIVHDFCKRKAMEEGLLHVVDGHFGCLNTTYHRWVSIERMDLEVSFNDSFCRSRSILFFCRTDANWFIDKITSFKMLRVLDLSSTPCFGWNLLFTNVGVDLLLLRYLALMIDTPLEMRMLKESFNNLFKQEKKKQSFNLQTLVLLAKEGRVPSPTMVYQIWRMPMLRHLKFSKVFMFDTLSVIQEYLQTIYWLRPSQCTKQVFFKIPNVTVMGIFIPTPMRVKEFESGFCFDDKYSLDENWLDDLINLGKLEKLKIDSLLSRPIILPHASAFPVQLRVLTLGGTLLPWDCIHLKKIPSSTFVELYSLQLIEFYACPFLLVHSAKEIQQQQQELFEHNWFGVHDYNTQEASIEEKEQVKRGKFEQQEREKLKYRASYPGSSYFAREVQEEEDAKLTDVNFFNCFEDDFDDNDINS